MNDSKTYVHPADPGRDGEAGDMHRAAAADRHANGFYHDRHACGLCYRRCAWCGALRLVEMLERINSSPALSCKAVKACEMRQADRDPAAELGALLRAVGAEMAALTTRELAELDYEMHGPYPHDWADGFTGSLRLQLGSRGDSAENCAAVAADRLARKRRRAALKGAETRKANREAATS